jgi:hypothetical protein
MESTMTRSRKILAGWLATGLVGMVLFVSTVPAFWMIAGLLFLAWGVSVAGNFRGIADAFPRRFGIGPFWQDTSPGMLRLTFAFFALWGAAIFAVGVHRAFF